MQGSSNSGKDLGVMDGHPLIVNSQHDFLTKRDASSGDYGVGAERLEYLCIWQSSGSIGKLCPALGPTGQEDVDNMEGFREQSREFK